MRQRTGKTSNRDPADLPPRSSCREGEAKYRGDGEASTINPLQPGGVRACLGGSSLERNPAPSSLHPPPASPGSACPHEGAAGAQLPAADMAGSAGAHQGRPALAPGLQLSGISQDPSSPGVVSARPAFFCGGLEMAMAPCRGEPCLGERGGWRARRGMRAAGGPH